MILSYNSLAKREQKPAMSMKIMWLRRLTGVKRVDAKNLIHEWSIIASWLIQLQDHDVVINQRFQLTETTDDLYFKCGKNLEKSSISFEKFFQFAWYVVYCMLLQCSHQIQLMNRLFQEILLMGVTVLKTQAERCSCVGHHLKI